MRRANARRRASEQRREELRLRRAGIAAGLVFGAAAFGAPASAGAAAFHVTNLLDSGAGSLRAAVASANATAGDDTIDFTGGGASGLIRLTTGAINILPADQHGKLTITGPGAGTLTVSGDKDSSGTPNVGDSQIFTISGSGSDPTGAVAISGLTLTNGYDSSAGVGGGAILDSDRAPLSLTDAAVTNSKTDASSGSFVGGGGILTNGALTLTRTVVSGNTATTKAGGGVLTAMTAGASKYPTKLVDSTISGNTAETGGGILTAFGPLLVQNTSVSGNHATSGLGGGVFSAAKYEARILNSVISGNSATGGGGGLVLYGYIGGNATTVRDTTVSGNQSPNGAGVVITNVRQGSSVLIDRSTLSGNQGGASSFGGGLLIERNIGGRVDLRNSTVSGNTATSGAGISFGSTSNSPLFGADSDGNTVGSINLYNSTIAANTADTHGGGLYLSQYDSGTPPVKKSGTITVRSSVIADNTAGGAAQDTDRVDTSTSGGFDLAFSLLETQGDAPVTATSSILGVDPKLGALADNGGPTKTMKPDGTSPLLDQGIGQPKMTVDQRGQPRPVDTGLSNPTNGDGTDIGAVELDAASVVLPPPTPDPTFLAGIHGVSIAGATPPLLAAESTPVDCAISTGQLSNCIVQLRAIAAMKTRRTVAAGALLGTGAIASAGAGTLSTTVTLNPDGRKLLAKRPLGLDMALVVTGTGTKAQTILGRAHVIASPSFPIRTGSRTAKFSKGVLASLDQVAALLKGAKTVTCTAYTDRTVSKRADNLVSTSQAKAACKRLTSKGVTAKTTVVGKGHSTQVASNKTAKGRAANRRVVITFTF